MAGFTLLEVLVSLTILSLALAVTYSSLTTALTSWGAGLERGRRGQVARVVLEKMAQQLKSVIPVSIAGEGTQRRPAFESGEDHIRFVTAIPVGVEGRPVQVSYSIEEVEGERRLVYRQYPWPDKDFFDPGDPTMEEEVDGIVGLKISLRAREEDEESGVPEAGGERPTDGDEAMPGGVEITLLLEGEETGPYSTTVSLQSEPWR